MPRRIHLPEHRTPAKRKQAGRSHSHRKPPQPEQWSPEHLNRVAVSAAARLVADGLASPQIFDRGRAKRDDE